MRKKLTRTGNSLALVLDKRLLDRVGIDADTPLDVSTNGQVIDLATERLRREKDAVESDPQESSEIA